MSIAFLQLAVPVAVFTAVVILLSLLVLVARHWLAPAGAVQIVVNGQRRFSAEAGSRLLGTLSRNGIYLSAACGGRGTCGQCRVFVRAGSRPLLPTEASHIGRQDAERGARLACMFTLREDIAIEVDRDLLAARRWDCTVSSNRFVAPFLRELTLAMPEGEQLEFEAGDYVLLEAPPHDVTLGEKEIDAAVRDDWQRVGFLGLRSVTSEAVVRAYSLANAPQQSDRAVLVVRFAAPPPQADPGTPPGKASSYVFSLKPGDHVTISGPFGEFHATDSEAEMVLIAGGAGIAPIRSMILDQLARGTGRRIGFWYGARDVQDLCYREDFDRLAEQYPNFSWHAALSAPRGQDWHGATGFIHTVAYEQYLKNHPTPEQAEYFLCGPPLMSAAVVHMLEDLGVPDDSIYFDDFGSV
ncbi:MAG: NADH:ubiquinone reductase (Na(+)-transporting) subunit F [Gammaproteobacteria bacterium]